MRKDMMHESDNTTDKHTREQHNADEIADSFAAIHFSTLSHHPDSDDFMHYPHSFQRVLKQRPELFPWAIEKLPYNKDTYEFYWVDVWLFVPDKDFMTWSLHTVIQSWNCIQWNAYWELLALQWEALPAWINRPERFVSTVPWSDQEKQIARFDEAYQEQCALLNELRSRDDLHLAQYRLPHDYAWQKHEFRDRNRLRTDCSDFDAMIASIPGKDRYDQETLFFQLMNLKDRWGYWTDAVIDDDLWIVTKRMLINTADGRKRMERTYEHIYEQFNTHARFVRDRDQNVKHNSVLQLT